MFNYLDVALTIREWNDECSIMPVNPETQKAYHHWIDYLDRRPTEKEIRYWGRRWPDALPGLVTKKELIVLNIDKIEELFPYIPPAALDIMCGIPEEIPKEFDARFPSSPHSVAIITPPAAVEATPPAQGPAPVPPMAAPVLSPGGPKSIDDLIPQGELAHDHPVKESFVKPVVRRRPVPPRRGTKADPSSIRISPALPAGPIEPLDTPAPAAPQSSPGKEAIPASKSDSRKRVSYQKMAGWFRLHRKIADHPFYRERRIFSRSEAWIDLLILTNHKDHKFLMGGEMVEAHRGEVITSELTLMERWRWSKSKVRRYISRLESESMVKKIRHPKRTILFIINWDACQRDETGKKTDERPTRDRPRYTINNEENEKMKSSLKERVDLRPEEIVASVHPPVSDPAEVGKDESNPTKKPILPSPKNDDIESVVNYWNEICGALPKILRLTDQRKISIRARLRDYSLEKLKEAFALVMESPFLLGENNRGWIVSFDWILKPSNLVKILEGNYQTKKPMSKIEKMQESLEALQRSNGDDPDEPNIFHQLLGFNNSKDPLDNALLIGSGQADEISANRPEPENPKPENAVVMCPVCQKETTRVDIEKLGSCPGCYRHRSPEVLKSIKDFTRKLNGKDPEKDSGHA